MRLAMIVLVLTLISAAVYALDLSALSRRERARREALENEKKQATLGSFDDSDLERYRRSRKTPVETSRARTAPARAPKERDLAKEKAFWERELVKHEREIARVDASIRRLELRLREREAKRRPGERLSRDPAGRLLEDSLESLREEKRRIEDRFRERARKAGAFPGWLRSPGLAR